MPYENATKFCKSFKNFGSFFKRFDLRLTNLYVQGDYVWAYATVLIGLLLGSIYATIIMRLHTWKTTKDQVRWII